MVLCYCCFHSDLNKVNFPKRIVAGHFRGSGNFPREWSYRDRLFDYNITFCVAMSSLPLRPSLRSLLLHWTLLLRAQDPLSKVFSSFLKDGTFLYLPLPGSQGTFSTSCHSSHSDCALLEISLVVALSTLEGPFLSRN